MVVCFFACLALLAIWWHLGRGQRDFGPVWLALSVLFWSISGAIEIYFAQRFSLVNNAESLEHLLFLQKGWRSVFSLCNSLFILMALSWFKYIPEGIRGLVKSRYWKFIVGIPFLFSLLPTLSSMFLGASQALISELDVYYSIFTLMFLGAVLWSSFVNRRLRFLAWLTILFILITFVAQVFKLISAPLYGLLFSAIFKSSLIMIFFALALSWVKELVQELQISPSHVSIAITHQKKDGRLVHTVEIEGLPGIGARRINLTPAHHEVLKKFCKKRLDGEGWLEVKPKNNRQGRLYDLQDYNQIKRLLHSMLDGLFGADNWTKDKHEKPLKEALFEWSREKDRRVRLRLDPAQISV